MMGFIRSVGVIFVPFDRKCTRMRFSFVVWWGGSFYSRFLLFAAFSMGAKKFISYADKLSSFPINKLPAILKGFKNVLKILINLVNLAWYVGTNSFTLRKTTCCDFSLLLPFWKERSKNIIFHGVQQLLKVSEKYSIQRSQTENWRSAEFFRWKFILTWICLMPEGLYGWKKFQIVKWFKFGKNC